GPGVSDFFSRRLVRFVVTSCRFQTLNDPLVARIPPRRLWRAGFLHGRAGSLETACRLRGCRGRERGLYGLRSDSLIRLSRCLSLYSVWGLSLNEPLDKGVTVRSLKPQYRLRGHGALGGVSGFDLRRRNAALQSIPLPARSDLAVCPQVASHDSPTYALALSS